MIVMKLSELITRLEHIKRVNGDLKVSTQDGLVVGLKATSCLDGVVVPQEQCNEVVLEFDARWE